MAGYIARLNSYLMCGLQSPTGVNLPARRVILRSLDQGPKGPVPRSTYLQMVGRAGRAGQSAIGESFIIGRGAADPSSGKGDWAAVCGVMTAPMPPLRSCLFEVCVSDDDKQPKASGGHWATDHTSAVDGGEGYTGNIIPSDGGAKPAPDRSSGCAVPSISVGTRGVGRRSSSAHQGPPTGSGGGSGASSAQAGGAPTLKNAAPTSAHTPSSEGGPLPPRLPQRPPPQHQMQPRHRDPILLERKHQQYQQMMLEGVANGSATTHDTIRTLIT